MKKLIISDSYYSCIKNLSLELKKYPASPKITNLVFSEEKMTLLIERDITYELSGSFNTRVFSLTRYLVSKMKAEKLLSKEGSTILIRKIIIENANKLKLLSSTRLKNLAPTVYELIAQLKSAGVTPSELKSAVKNISGVLKDKIIDISMIFTIYEETLAINGYTDQNNYLSELPQIINNDESLNTANIFIVGYSSFTRQAKDVIKAFNAVSNNVSAFLVGGENEGVYTNEAVNNYKRMFEGILLEDKSNFNENKTAEFITKYLFNPEVFGENFKKSETKDIFLYEATSIEEEIKRVASIIKREVIESGFRYKDFIVATDDINAYGETIKSVFNSYNIPLFIDEKVKLSEHQLSKLIISYIETYRKGGAAKDFFAVVKNPLFCSDKDLLDEMENYILKLGIGRGGLYNAFSETGEKFENLRNLASSEILKLKSKASANEYVKIIKVFLADIEIDKKLEEYYTNLMALGESDAETIATQAKENLFAILEEIERLLSDAVISIDEFKSVLLSGINASEIAVLPQFNDAVFIGGFKECRLSKARYLFAVGLNTNVPSSKSDIALLNDGDIDKLSELKVAVEPKIRVVNKREKENVGLALSAFSERLYLSYSMTSSAGKSLKKSEIFAYITNMFICGDKQIKMQNKAFLNNFYIKSDENIKNRIDEMKFITKKQSVISFAETLALYKADLVKDLTALSSYYSAIKGEDKLIIDELLEKENTDPQQILKENKDIILRGETISTTTIENFYVCPYKNFLEKGLRLNERELGEIRPMETGIFIHGILDNYTKNISSVTGKESSDKLTETLAEEILSDKKYSRFLAIPNEKSMIARLKEEAKVFTYKIFKQYENSEFKFYRSEVAFGAGKEFKAIPLDTDGKQYFIEGKVDRIDKYNEYIRIVDYKTGALTSSDKYLFIGEKLQLYLYMLAFTKNLGKAGGMYYYQIDNSFKSGAEKQLDGYTLKNSDVIRASDTTVDLISKKGEIINSAIKTDKKSGEITYSTKKSLDESELNAYIGYAKKMAEKGAENIAKGVIIASPFEKACDNCNFKGMCDFNAESESPRGVKRVNKETIICSSKENYEIKR